MKTHCIPVVFVVLKDEEEIGRVLARKDRSPYPGSAPWRAQDALGRLISEFRTKREAIEAILKVRFPYSSSLGMRENVRCTGSLYSVVRNGAEIGLVGANVYRKPLYPNRGCWIARDIAYRVIGIHMTQRDAINCVVATHLLKAKVA